VSELISRGSEDGMGTGIRGRRQGAAHSAQYIGDPRTAKVIATSMFGYWV
jgi:hypothetical protein